MRFSAFWTAGSSSTTRILSVSPGDWGIVFSSDNWGPKLTVANLSTHVEDIILADRIPSQFLKNRFQCLGMDPDVNGRLFKI